MGPNTRIGNEAGGDGKGRLMDRGTGLSQRRHALSAGGFAYIALLILIAIIGVALASAGQVWYMEMKREKEAELLFIGDQMRVALARYYSMGGGMATTLKDLVKDPRTPATRRYLRRVYSDPMTGSEDWGLVKGPSGEILGVYSRSDEEPSKKSNFSLADQQFEGKAKYSEWVFMIPARNTPAQLNGAAPSTPAPGGALPQRTIP